MDSGSAVTESVMMRVEHGASTWDEMKPPYPSQLIQAPIAPYHEYSYCPKDRDRLCFLQSDGVPEISHPGGEWGSHSNELYVKASPLWFYSRCTALPHTAPHENSSWARGQLQRRKTVYNPRRLRSSYY